MAPQPKPFINHFTHEGHPLKPVETVQEFLCDGCKTLGAGKRYRCHGCDFDMHEYCGTCPRLLQSFMHPHPLTLVVRRPQQFRQTYRICDVCRDQVEGMFYRCKECEFDVHPLCTQLPERLNHALHNIHPLILKPSKNPNFCSVCKNLCTGWRYRCSICNVDIHLECVLTPVVPCSKNDQRGIPMFGQHVPFQPPPHFAGYPGFYYNPGFHGPEPGYNPGFVPGFGQPYYPPPYTYPYPNFMPPPNNNQQVGGSNNNGKPSGGVGKKMFAIVGQLGFGVLSNMIFGVDISSFMF